MYRSPHSISGMICLVVALSVGGLVPVQAEAFSRAASSGNQLVPVTHGVIRPAGTVSARAATRIKREPVLSSRLQAPAPGLLIGREGRAYWSHAPHGPLNGTATARDAGAAPVRDSASPTRALRVRAGFRSSKGGARSAAGTSPLENLLSFTGATGASTSAEPPNPQIAVSPTRVLVASNTTATVFDRGGKARLSFDITGLMTFAQAQSYGSNPRVAYDSGSRRWYMSLMVCRQAPCSGNWSTMGVDLAISASSDPGGTWFIFQNLFAGDKGNMQGEPKLGFSDDKLTMTANIYLGHCDSGTCFDHEDVLVFNKSDLLGGKVVHYEEYTSGFAFDAVPAIPTPSSAGSDSTQYVAWQGFGALGIAQITGVPNVSAVNFNVQSPQIGSPTTPVDAPGLPVGAESSIFVKSVSWNSNHLWAVWSDGCTFQVSKKAASVQRDCIRVDEVNTSNAAALSVQLDQDIGQADAFYNYPSVAEDCSSGLVIGATYSNTEGKLPSVSVIGTTTPGSGYVRQEYLSGDTAYSGSRWGGYSATVQDPGDCKDVWTAQEYGAVHTGAAWAVGIGQFTFRGPSVTSISAGAGPATGGTQTTISGQEFVNGGTRVTFGSRPAAAVRFVDSQHVAATSPAGTGGPVDVTVATGNGSATASRAWSWVPVVTGIHPAAGPAGGGGNVKIIGAGFTGATGVHFGTAPALMLVNNDGSITANVPAGTAGTVDVTVTGATGTSAIVAADRYTYENKPAVSGISPVRGPAAGGTLVTISGRNFTPGVAVKFGGVSAAAVSFVSATRLKAKSPAHVDGTVDVRVTTPGGTSPTSAADTFTFEAVPTVKAVKPAAGPTTGGTVVTIGGTGFHTDARVRFGQTAATGVTFVSSTSLKARAPAHVAGLVDVRVTTVGGTSPAGAADRFAYQPH